ncbi:MAG: 1-acyl-sn-glycerol-3-phosphate acyltransferase [Cyanobacteria bacterium P01_A01_bin.84]
MTENNIRAQSKLNFIPPKFNSLILHLGQLSLPILMRVRTRPWLPAGIKNVEVKNVESLAQFYHQFQTGKIRLLMAFHHPEIDDPLSIAHMLYQIMPKVAHRQGISLHKPIHTHFMYDRGMLLWAGKWLGWLFSSLGGIPIRRGRKLDLRSLQAARKILLNAQFPLTIAPEGATNGHSGIVSPLEPGVAQLGFWCVEDLIKANRNEEVIILPLGVQYYYPNTPWKKLNWLLSKLEKDSGLTVQEIKSSDINHNQEQYYQRILRLAEHITGEIEEFYRRFYHQDLPQDITGLDSLKPHEALFKRIERLQNTALQVVEQYLNLESEGTLAKRCRRIEEETWKYIYREEFDLVLNLNNLPSLQKGLADWVAKEANLKIRHMRLVETFVAVTANYLKEKPSFERFAEMSLLIFDAIARIREGKIPGRPRLGLRQAQITIGEPISVTQRWESYNSSRKAGKQAVTKLTDDLKVALESLVE